ncbi:hypothetical protein PV328_009488 [Microctonus aethiopoides]|uniref:Uncharacterized protein n=1 Tax=Microctonus aethiopoides TaxID=144406 RepID=A0AA39EZF2_9HYME|nr:hypothetical protein PV328_009488 [Microctonus aethiopoides]
MKSALSITKFNLIIVMTIVMIGIDADIRRECRKESGVSWKSLKKLKAADFNQNDPKLKCYVKCFMQKNGIFNDKDVDIEKTVKHLPSSIQETSKKTLLRCKKLPSTDLCDRAFQLAKCYFKAQPEVLKSVSMV